MSFWNVNSSGDFTSNATGVTCEPEGARLRRWKPTSARHSLAPGRRRRRQTIANNGTTKLAAVGNLFELTPPAGGRDRCLSSTAARSRPASSGRRAGRRSGRNRREMGTKSPLAGRPGMWSGTSTAAATSPATPRRSCPPAAPRLRGWKPTSARTFAGAGTPATPPRLRPTARRPWLRLGICTN